MNVLRCIDTIKNAEGRKVNIAGLHIPYLDSRDVWTIGYGQTRLNGEKVTGTTKPITEEQALMELKISFVDAVYDAEQFITLFHELNDVRQEALTEMAFQLGGPKQRGFVKARAAGNMRDYDTMADELLDSAWHGQTPARCERIAKMVRTGVHFLDDL
jgi:GH24 family phage-related lysozyme (muramidase)